MTINRRLRVQQNKGVNNSPLVSRQLICHLVWSLFVSRPVGSIAGATSRRKGCCTGQIRQAGDLGEDRFPRGTGFKASIEALAAARGARRASGERCSPRAQGVFGVDRDTEPCCRSRSAATHRLRPHCSGPVDANQRGQRYGGPRNANGRSGSFPARPSKSNSQFNVQMFCQEKSPVKRESRVVENRHSAASQAIACRCRYAFELQACEQ